MEASDLAGARILAVLQATAERIGMRNSRTMAVAACCAGLLAGAGPAAAGASAIGRLSAPDRAAASGGIWGKAKEVPGLGALNSGRNASVASVSCASAGNCAAGGYYTDSSGHSQGFVVSERNGSWGKAKEVPGLGALNAGGHAQVLSVSCPSAGNCAAGGYYTDSSGHSQGFVVSKRNGSWGNALEVPRLGALNTGGMAVVRSVSCASAGDCVAGGGFKDYSIASGGQQGFVVSERDGVWGKALQVPGLAALNAGANAGVTSVSCPSAGNCAAGGYYSDSLGSGTFQGFVVSERNGSWGNALEVPGLGALNTRGLAVVMSVSCSSAGNCAAGGHYVDSTPSAQGFVVSERNGVWRDALEVPGLGSLNAGDNAEVLSVSCPSAGNCGAAGSYNDIPGHFEGFVVGQANGAWGRAKAVTFSVGARVLSVSCPSAGNCGAAGLYWTSPSHSHGFVISESNGSWGKAIEVPGLGALGVEGAEVTSVSCPSAGECDAVGSYLGQSRAQGFVADQT
jgi:hypothetical protein